jgi:DNA-directed RNA polymerase subunit RPC12/RpoP
MGRDQAWCMKCKKPVDVIGLTAADSRNSEMISGQCKECGSEVHRLRAK